MNGYLEAENLGIRFWLERRETALIRDIVFHPFRKRETGDELWALRNVSFCAERGRVLGVIGENGAGKTTLLMALANIYQPDEGRVRLRGRVTSLLEVGAGFRLELTGRENVFLYGAIMGMPRRDVLGLFDWIVDFAGLEGFIDSPMRMYSTGMRMRLGFAVAMSVRPDILLVDEALSIGDSAFQNKALKAVRAFCREGGMLIYVSHDMTRVGNVCDECLLLEKGRMIESGKPLDVIATYWEKVWGKRVNEGSTESEEAQEGMLKGARRWGSGEIRITKFSLFDEKGDRTRFIEQGTPFRIEIQFEGACPYEDMLIQVSVFRGKETVAVMKAPFTAFLRDLQGESGRAVLRVDSDRLALGEYRIDAEIRNEAFTVMCDHLDKFFSMHIIEAEKPASRPEWMVLPCQWTFLATGRDA